MECGVRLEAKLQLLFVWMWKCNTAALAHRDSAVFSRGKAAFCCREIYYYNLPLLFTQREENRKECIYGSSVGRYGVLVTCSQENTMGRANRRGGLLGDFSGEDVEKDY